ncbi:ranBP2-type zinc finger protein At1g67325-like [Bidens hawaiensis]|uniref:ranBP2-type zinc finger protein At1g67325-like n=1 Tax=Bidens hawaiensis TaxID=980011 RepID=UPI00404B3D26
MRNCTQPRPPNHNYKSALRQMPTPHAYSSSSPYTPAAAAAAAASMYVGVPPSLFNATSVPPPYLYNYNNRLAGGTPYQPSATPPYSAAAIIGNGGIYGLPQLMDQFGLRLPMGQTAMGPQPGFFTEETSHNKEGTRENDWECPNCGNVNFAFRTVCNMRKCNTPKTGTQAAKPSKIFKTDMPEGSWKCEKCNNINYPFRTKCNRQNCGAGRPSESENLPLEEENNEQ